MRLTRNRRSRVPVVVEGGDLSGGQSFTGERTGEGHFGAQDLSQGVLRNLLRCHSHPFQHLGA